MSLSSRKPIRPCGRRFASEDDAMASKKGGSGNYYPEACRSGWCEDGIVHLRHKPPPLVLTMKPAKASTSQQDTFPPAVRVLIDARDSDDSTGHPVRLCQRCGRSRNLHRHHRRGKDAGGSSNRPHTHCPCNGVTLCGPWGDYEGCHPYLHNHPEEAEAEGWIASQSEDEPGSVGVMRFAAAEGGATQWPDCKGRWLETAAEAREVA